MGPDIMRKLAKPMLFGAAIIWGTSFFIMKNALDVMPVFSLLAVRFTAGAIVLGLVCWHRCTDFSADYLCRSAIIVAFLFLAGRHHRRVPVPGLSDPDLWAGADHAV